MCIRLLTSRSLQRRVLFGQQMHERHTVRVLLREACDAALPSSIGNKDHEMHVALPPHVRNFIISPRAAVQQGAILELQEVSSCGTA